MNTFEFKLCRRIAEIALGLLFWVLVPVAASGADNPQGGDTYSVTRYDAFGRIEHETSPDTPRFGFTGYQRGPVPDLYYAEQRWYDASHGRFLSEDPVWGEPQQPLSLHRYLYAYANPTVWVDPDGRWPLARDLMGRKDFAQDLDDAGYGIVAAEAAQYRSLQLAGARVRAGQGVILSAGAGATTQPAVGAVRYLGSVARAVWQGVAAAHAEIQSVGLVNAALANPHTVTVVAGEVAITGAALASGADTPLTTAASTTRRATTHLGRRAEDAASMAHRPAGHGSTDIGLDDGSIATRAQFVAEPSHDLSAALTWVDEGGNLRAGGSPGMRPDAYHFQSSASGARSNALTGRSQAPFLEFSDSAGAATGAKFDGVMGTELIDRKLNPVFSPKAADQARRQVAVAQYHGMQVVWELPTPQAVSAARRMLESNGIEGIAIRLVEQ